MKVTVNEALRIRNEIRESISNMRYKEKDDYAVKKTGDTEPKVGEYTASHFIEDTFKLQELSLAVEDAIATFNVTSGITTLVKKIKSNDALIGVLKGYTSCKEHIKSVRVMRGDDVVEEPVAYLPVVSSKFAKARIKELRRASRAHQSEIEKHNSSEIELPFEYTDIEDYV